MKTLTHDQADLLRDVRTGTRAVAAKLQETASRLLGGCDHEDYVADCPLCNLEKLAAECEKAYGRLVMDIDWHLERGPHPASRGRLHDDEPPVGDEP